MKIKEQAIKELDSLTPSELMTVYEIIILLKTKILKSQKNNKEHNYIKVRRALSNCKGSLSDDILSLREERI